MKKFFIDILVIFKKPKDTMIICGGYHMIIKNEKNEIYVCGRNLEGQLGLGDNKNRSEFEKVDFEFGEIIKIACGYNHTIIQNKKNEVYVCGWNKYGQLGLGDNEYKNRDKFEKVKCNFGKIKDIACGENITVIQNDKNEIYVCGRNLDGELGLGDYEDRNRFEKVKYDFGIIKNIACGDSHIVIQNEKDEIHVCGRNVYGQLGWEDNKDRYKFEKVEHDFGKIKNIACGSDHTIIQNEKNELYVCGNNIDGQLGLDGFENIIKFKKVKYDLGDIKKIICSSNHTIIQNEQNEIYVCGENCHGQFGFGDNEPRYKFEKINFDFGKIKNIVSGIYHIVIQGEKNGIKKIYVCGGNKYGQLGVNDNKDKKIFKKVNIDEEFKKIYIFELKLNVKNIEL